MRRISVLTFAVCALVASSVVPAMGTEIPASFSVGFGKRDISPTAAEIATGDFFMGGFGFGSSRIGTADHYVNEPFGIAEERTAVGVMGETLADNPFAPWVRAIAIGDGTKTIVLADYDNQGTFPTYKPNPSTGALRPFGIDDIRAAASAATGGALEARSIMLSSDHSHAGQDLTGVWGFVPDSYLARVKQLAVEAIVEAYTSMQPAILKHSAVETPQPCGPASGSATRIFSNQFCGANTLGDDQINSLVNAQVRVLRAFRPSDPNGDPFAVLVNASIHATVGGSGNRYISSDWVSTVSSYIERQYPGAGAVTIVGDVGRTQPNRDSCDASSPSTFVEPLSGLTVAYDRDPRAPDSCNISQFARRVQAWVNKAVADTEVALTTAGVDYRELFIRDPSTSVLLFGLNSVGDIAGVPIVRGIAPPYFTGNFLGTWVGAYRVGDVLMISAPGEAYPNMRLGVLDVVETTKATWAFGLANDQLGYLIAPFPQGYPEPIRRSFFDGDPQDPTAWGISPIDNDNYFFNVSHTLGDHIMCTQIKGALQLGFEQKADVPANCAPWMAEVNESGPGDPTWKPPVP